MKRKDLMKKLKNTGHSFKEGGNHTKVYDINGNFKCTVGRHTEIEEFIVDKIERQTGVKLR